MHDGEAATWQSAKARLWGRTQRYESDVTGIVPVTRGFSGLAPGEENKPKGAKPCQRSLR